MTDFKFAPGEGSLTRHPDFPSKYTTARNIEVWCPPDYDQQPDQHYPVIYMHDGQNLFDPAQSTLGVTWGIAETLCELRREGQFQGAIVVGIWQSGTGRMRYYMPQKPLEAPAAKELKAEFVAATGAPVSDDYLRFVVEELKPFIDHTYRTLSAQPHTFLVGSSMGGLISLYGLVEYPAIFGGAGCLSTHWPVGGNLLVDYLGEALPQPGNHKLYFDFGTEGLDSEYEPYQRRMDGWLRGAGFTPGQDWLTLKFEEANHSEPAWSERLAFLYASCLV